MMKIRHLFRQIPLMLLLLASLLPAEAAVFVDGDTLSQKPRIALVLGGGGAKGAAHVGALKVIEEAGIRPDIIVGTSIGAIVGGLYSIGYRAADLDTLFRSQQWLQLFTREAIRGDAIKAMLNRLVAPDTIRKTEGKCQFACIATDLSTLSEVVLENDSLARNLRASMSIPGVFRPVRFDNYVLLDGGMLNNLPVDVARQMGANIVIAVDLTVNHHEKEEKEDFNISDLFDISKVKGMVGWLLNRPDFKKYKQNCLDANILINPPLTRYAATSFARQRIEEMIQLGEQAARAHISELQQLAASQDSDASGLAK